MDKHAPFLGPAASSLLVPKTPTEVAFPSIKNMEAYYLPYAFMLPQAHPALGDRQSSFDFACFLLLLIEDIIEGRSISDRVVINPSTKYNLLRNQILGLLPSIAESLIKLFEPVFINEPANHGSMWFDEWCKWMDQDRASHRESPKEAIKSLIIKKPSIYQNLRGIGFILFDPKLFSPEFYNLKLTKKIFSDFSLPSDSSTESLSSYDIESLRGRFIEELGTTHRLAYFVDPLPEKQYDDNFIITDSSLNRSESIIEQQVLNSSDDSKYTLNLKPVSSKWTYGNTNQSFYPLPERCLPPLPRPVRVNALPVDTVPVDTSQSLLWHYSTNDWNTAYTESVKGLNQLSLGLVNSADPTLFKQFDQETDQLSRLPSSSLSSISEDWKYMSSSLAHFYFAFDLQILLDNSNKKYFDLIKNLVFEIETEMWGPEILIEETIDQPVQPPPDNNKNLQLLNSFSNHRLRLSGKQVESSQQIAQEEFLNQIKAWLVTENTSLLMPPTLKVNSDEVNTQQPSPIIPTITTRIQLNNRDNPGWQINQIIPADDQAMPAFGSVVGFEILPQVQNIDSTVNLDHEPANKYLSSAIIRISVLDHPFCVTRTRLRVLRNWIDVDSDAKSDMNPCFILSSGYSPWACEGRQPVVINLREQNQSGLTILTSDLQTWLDRSSFDASHALDSFLFPTDTKSWPVDLLKSSEYDVTASIYRTILDGSIRYGAALTTNPIPSRSITSVRQILQSKGNEIDSLLGNLNPSEIMTLFPWIQLTWRDSTGHPLLTIEAAIKIVETTQQ